MLSALVLWALLSTWGCGSGTKHAAATPSLDAGAYDAASRADAGSPQDAASPQDASTDAAYLNTLSQESDFDRLAGTVVAGELKYLARTVGRPAIEPLDASCYFQNARLFPWHLQFLQAFSSAGQALSFDLYRQLVVRETTRRMWGGSLRRWPEARYPGSASLGLVSFDIYAESGGLTVDRIAEVDAIVKTCAPFARERLVFVATGADQEELVEQQRAALAAVGVTAMLPGELTPDLDFTAYSRGEAYGYLRLVPLGEALTEYGPRDVVAVESAPQDISIVAGLLTKNPQNELGHVNLRLHEKAIPNASLPGLYDTREISALDGKLVHVIVADDLSVEAASIDDAEAFWAAHRPSVRTPTADLTRSALLALSDLHASDAAAYGAKCANLGELTHVLAAPHRPDGFGIPFVRYRDAMRDGGIEAQVEQLIAALAAGGDANAKRAALEMLRDTIKTSALPDGLLAELGSAIDTAFGSAGRTLYLRFRSSTNVEDLDSLTGAGLYDSRSGCLADDLDGDDVGPSACLTADKQAALELQHMQRSQELADHPERTYLRVILDDIQGDLSKEKPVADALRKVWASLWNERAFDERAYYGIDQRAAFMGVAVHPAYSLEQANAVVVSNLQVDDGAPLYRLNSQVGELSVVTPEDPTAVAEVLTFRRDHTPAEAVDIQVLLGSSLLPAGMEVWPHDKLLELSQLLFVVHDHFASQVYPQQTSLSLDFEVKLERSGDVAIKQVRPYVNSDP